MENEQLKTFIKNRKSEQKRCMETSDYLDELYKEFQFTTDQYATFKKILNRRFFFLEKSILDHSKLLKGEKIIPEGAELFCSNCEKYTTYGDSKSGTIELTEDYTKNVSICPNCLHHSVLSDCT